MKKFLLPVLLALAIFLPTTAALAADIPNIRQISPNNIKYLVATFENDPNYIYECNDGKFFDYAQQYSELLIKEYSFKLALNYSNDETKVWALTYTGTKNFAPITDTENHIMITATAGSIILIISKDISYEGN
ncbi:MAG: hypothetical protein II968_06760 [Selenomonadaceae bacterium]|nr:hypothetical protein [Selenomonadaceae bacterium]MBQ7493935.1 hypothetical protein [Selenomonadaceae bacterium]